MFLVLTSSLFYHNDGIRVFDIFKPISEKTSNDEEMCSVINPDDFLNESFFLDSNVRIKTESESSGSGNDPVSPMSHSPSQLTPPISPQPPYLSLILPISNENSSTCTVKKIQPILPAVKGNSGSSDSDSTSKSTVMDKNLIKQARIIRNRESALKSRHRKKEYLQSLEVEVCELRKEVKNLKEENGMLKQKLVEFTYQRASSTFSKISTTKNATFMLAMLLMVGFNLIPLSNYLSNSLVRDIERPSVSITSRHLLFVVNETDSMEKTSNESDNSYIPLKYLNQTDRVRKANIENVLNWIPQPSELLNVTRKVNFESNLKKFEDPLQYKLSQLYEKSRANNLNPKKQFRKRPQKPTPPPADENLYNPELFKFQEFFDEIQRKEDTFYVLSRSFDNLLLPAELETFSQIPLKMNLIMPRNDTLTAQKNKIMMMQIETIVLNTSIIEVKSIPSELVKETSNSTTTCNHQKNITRNENLPKARKLVPYFRLDLNSRK